MIPNDEGLEVSIDQLARMYRALGDLHAHVAPLNYNNYQILAEGPIDHIMQLRREIDEYLGIMEASAAVPRSE